VRTLSEQLAGYAAYHQDRRNIWTHQIGIPLIVLGAAVLASRPAALPSPAMLIALPLAVFYLRLDLRLGAAMAVLLTLAVWAGHVVAEGSEFVWLTAGIGLFVVGWTAQFIGHAYEGKKPAFTEDLTSLAIGPLFIVADLAVRAGLRPELRRALQTEASGTGSKQASRQFLS
jgi:uncharacterized membrane protein YGL010W